MNHFYYKGFTVEQYAADEYFQQWVLHSSDGHEAFWSSFQNLYPAENTNIINARQLVRELTTANYSDTGLSVEEKDTMKNEIFYRIGEVDFVSSPDTINIPKKRYLPQLFAVAALLAITFVAVYLFLQRDSSTPDLLIAVTTGILEKKEIVLPDSSIVILNAGSSIKYSQNFPSGPNREVYLEGNAFFKVRRTALLQPFVVHANNLSIIVLGTEFNVNARSVATAVALVNGKLKVEKQGAANIEEYISPGEEIKLDEIQQQFVRTKIDTQLYAAWTEEKWIFQQTRLEDVMALVKDYYGTDAVFTTAASKQLKISAVIPVTDADILMQIISKTLRIKIDKVNSRFVIQKF